MSEEQVVKSEKQLSMTPEAIRKREARQKKREQEEIKARGGESIEEMWQRNSKLLLEEDPKLYESLQARHDEVNPAFVMAGVVVMCLACSIRCPAPSVATRDCR